MAKTFSYNKKEKLKSHKQLQALFSNGKSFLVFPIKVFYLQPEAFIDNLVKAGVGASSRSFKKAVQRNRIKRLLREAYRLNKLPLHHILQTHNCRLVIFLLYIDKQMPQNNFIQAKMPAVIERLMGELAKQFEERSTIHE